MSASVVVYVSVVFVPLGVLCTLSVSHQSSECCSDRLQLEPSILVQCVWKWVFIALRALSAHRGFLATWSLDFIAHQFVRLLRLDVLVLVVFCLRVQAPLYSVLAYTKENS